MILYKQQSEPITEAKEATILWDQETKYSS